MNTIGIDHNLDRARIKKLLTIGLFASIMTGIGDFLLGYAEELPGVNFAASVMAGAPNLTDGQMITGGLLGFFGIFLEGLACFAVYRLMADAAPKYAHLYRAGIFGYIWLAPVGCHMNVGLLNLAYKYLLKAEDALAAKSANLPQGYATPIGENGAKLSGGERQRISIARALLKDAPIVLLDEATASLDVENETKVQGALSRLLTGKTVLVIAHRMRTVEAADKIVVLKDGKVAEEGRPEELFAREDGMFRRMTELQAASAGWTI